MRQLCKGNVAVMKGAVLAGCKAYYGYPITPASEIAEAAAEYLPQVGGTFVQAESEVAAINMVYGAASTGQRAMTASSGPGLSLMQEGMSYLAGSELPCVVVDVVRGGPGLGNIAPEQSDYFCVVKGGGHGNYKNLVLAPASVQEMADLTMLAFELADRYRNPAVVLTDGFIGQMMEPLQLDGKEISQPEKPWAVRGTADRSADRRTAGGWADRETADPCHLASTGCRTAGGFLPATTSRIALRRRERPGLAGVGLVRVRDPGARSARIRSATPGAGRGAPPVRHRPRLPGEPAGLTAPGGPRRGTAWDHGRRTGSRTGRLRRRRPAR